MTKDLAISLLRISAGTQKTRTTGCHPFVEVVGYLCSRIINSVARFVYMRANNKLCAYKYTFGHLLRLVSELQLETSYISTNQTTSVSKRFYINMSCNRLQTFAVQRYNKFFIYAKKICTFDADFFEF